MITLISLTEQVYLRIPSHEEVAIYSTTYYEDQNGNTFEEFPSGERASLPVKILGDMIVESEKKRYVFKRVYAGYEKVIHMINLMCKASGQGDVKIVLEDLPGVDFVAGGGFEVQVLHQ